MNPFVSELQDVSVTKLIFIYWKSKRLVVPVGLCSPMTDYFVLERSSKLGLLSSYYLAYFANESYWD